MSDIPGEFRVKAREALSVASGEVTPGTYIAIENQVARALLAEREAATMRERERCAKISSDFALYRPLVSYRPTERVYGRFVGEQAAAAAIEAAILKGEP